MRWFLDMCIILYYAGESDDINLKNKTKRFVNNKNKDGFFLCYYIKDVNLPKWKERQHILKRELIRQIKDQNYQPFSSNESQKLHKRDKIKLKKLKSLARRTDNKEKFLQKFQYTQAKKEHYINHFIEYIIDEFVIPKKELDIKLKSCLFTWLAPNDSDARTIASAIQEHNKKELKILTADKKDWTKELLEKTQYDYQLKKRYKKLPDIEYLQKPKNI